MAKRKRKIKRSPPPWKSAIGVAALAHLVVIAGIIALSWHHFTTVRPGSAVFINDVVDDAPGAGDGLPRGDRGQASALPRREANSKEFVESNRRNQPPGNSPGQAFTSAGEGLRPSRSPRVSHPQLQEDSRATNGTTLGESNNEINNGVSPTGTNVGTGNGTGTGHAGAGDPTLAEIRRRIESAKRYPAQARSMHQEGRVGIHFKILPNGQVTEVRVSQSSGIATLDDAAVQAVQRSTPLPAYTNAIDLSLAFRLR